jgi:hypothetical protein
MLEASVAVVCASTSISISCTGDGQADDHDADLILIRSTKIIIKMQRKRSCLDWRGHLTNQTRRSLLSFFNGTGKMNQRPEIVEGAASFLTTEEKIKIKNDTQNLMYLRNA